VSRWDEKTRRIQERLQRKHEAELAREVERRRSREKRRARKRRELARRERDRVEERARELAKEIAGVQALDQVRLFKGEEEERLRRLAALERKLVRQLKGGAA